MPPSAPPSGIQTNEPTNTFPPDFTTNSDCHTIHPRPVHLPRLIYNSNSVGASKIYTRIWRRPHKDFSAPWCRRRRVRLREFRVIRPDFQPKYSRRHARGTQDRANYLFAVRFPWKCREILGNDRFSALEKSEGINRRRVVCVVCAEIVARKSAKCGKCMGEMDRTGCREIV